MESDTMEILYQFENKICRCTSIAKLNSGGTGGCGCVYTLKECGCIDILKLNGDQAIYNCSTHNDLY